MQTSVYVSLHSKLDRVFLSYDVKALRLLAISTPYIRLVKFQPVRRIPDVYVSACVILLYFSQNT